MKRDKPDIDARLRNVLAIHFDPERGSPFWIDRAARMGFDPREETQSIAALSKLGLLNPRDLANIPMEAMLPRPILERRRELVIAQTGGTLGRPVWTAYLRRDFHEAFVEPFVVAAQHVGFPTGGTWLYVGPSGPHIIGRAADAIACATGSMRPFSIDFDPRWAKKLTAGSFAAQRYLQHLVDQAMAVVSTQGITVLFSTPVVVQALTEAMSRDQRERIRGVHYGGMGMTEDELNRMQTEGFPNAVHLSGYGNTLFGCCLELDVAAHREFVFYPYADRLLLGVLDQDGDAGEPIYGVDGQEGPLVFSRLDETLLLLNVVERDAVRLCEPPKGAPEGFRLMGVASPTPRTKHQTTAAVSLY